jgi:hypothetical protein
MPTSEMCRKKNKEKKILKNKHKKIKELDQKIRILSLSLKFSQYLVRNHLGTRLKPHSLKFFKNKFLKNIFFMFLDRFNVLISKIIF